MINLLDGYPAINVLKDQLIRMRSFEVMVSDRDNQKFMNLERCFGHFYAKMYDVGTHWNCLFDVIFMCTHIIYFYGEMMKIFSKLS